MTTKIDYRALERDLYADIACPSCFAITKLSGYADGNFFDYVNREPHVARCKKCERLFVYQWFRDGVAVHWTEVTNDTPTR